MSSTRSRITSAFGAADRRMQRDKLAVDVGLVDDVRVDQQQPSYAGAGQRLGGIAPHAAETEHGHRRSREPVHGLPAEQPGRPFKRAHLPLHAAAAAVFDQRLDLRGGGDVAVALHRMLEAGGGDGELNGVLRRLPLQQRIDQPRAEAVPAAHAVDDMDVVFGREIRLPAGVKHPAPAVDRSRNRLAQRDGRRVRPKRSVSWRATSA